MLKQFGKDLVPLILLFIVFWALSLFAFWALIYWPIFWQYVLDSVDNVWMYTEAQLTAIWLFSMAILLWTIASIGVYVENLYKRCK